MLIRHDDSIIRGQYGQEVYPSNAWWLRTPYFRDKFNYIMFSNGSMIKIKEEFDSEYFSLDELIPSPEVDEYLNGLYKNRDEDAC